MTGSHASAGSLGAATVPGGPGEAAEGDPGDQRQASTSRVEALCQKLHVLKTSCARLRAKNFMQNISFNPDDR